jgi:hypothetical protein
MNLSLPEAAARLQLTERQIRYMIKTGRLSAHKVADRWQIAEADLPGAPGHPQQVAARAAALETAVAAALAPHVQPARSRVWTVQRMRAFTAAVEIHRELRELAAPRATAALEACVLSLSRGNHAFGPRTKDAAFTSARDAAADGVAWLWLELAGPSAIADRIEAEVIPQISGLLRRAEGRRQP